MSDVKTFLSVSLFDEFPTELDDPTKLDQRFYLPGESKLFTWEQVDKMCKDGDRVIWEGSWAIDGFLIQESDEYPGAYLCIKRDDYDEYCIAMQKEAEAGFRDLGYEQGLIIATKVPSFLLSSFFKGLKDSTPSKRDIFLSACHQAEKRRRETNAWYLDNCILAAYEIRGWVDGELRSCIHAFEEGLAKAYQQVADDRGFK